MRQRWFLILLTFAFAVASGGAVVRPAAAGQPAPDANHLLCYKIKDTTKLKGTIADAATQQLGELTNCKVKKAKEICVPAYKQVKQLADGITPEYFQGGGYPDDYVCYKIKCDKVTPIERRVLDQFGVQNVELKKPFKLCVPAVQTEACVDTGRTFVQSCQDLSDPNSEAACNNAWQVGGTGATSCFYGMNAHGSTGCYGCGPYNALTGVCTNECSTEPIPFRCLNGARTYVDHCPDLAADPNNPAACNNAWHIGGEGPTACFYGERYNGGLGCWGCGPDNEAPGLCTNDCSDTQGTTCDNPARVYVGHCPDLAADPNNPAACNNAWHLGGEGPTACFYGANHDDPPSIGCWGCGPDNELASPSLCTNDCKRCADATRVLVESCRNLSDPNGEAACNNAWHYGGTGPTSCFFGVNYYGRMGCWGCGPDNEKDTACTNSCKEL